MKQQILVLLSLALAFHAQAGGATWNLNPTSSDWNTAANWTPATVPNGSGDIASFGVSNQATVILSADTDVNSIIYNDGASSYNTTVPTGVTLTVFNSIRNNSGVAQETFTIEGGGQILFNFSSSAGADYKFTLGDHGGGVPESLQFSGETEASLNIFNLKGDGSGANCVFLGESSTGDTFNVNGADSAAHSPGVLTFAENSTGGGVIIATSGSSGGEGGKVIFRDSASCIPSLEVYGNASFDISGSTRPFPNAVLSLKGDGLVFLGGRQLNYSGDVEAIFSGIIQDGGASGGSGGSLVLNGRGPLTLSGANTYSGGTTIDDRVPTRFAILSVLNKMGSGTGSGPVTVNQGILGGSGTISGPVTVAGVTSSQTGTLAPAAGGNAAFTLTIRNLLTFGANGVYNPLIQSKRQKVRSDRVNARGVTIERGARFDLLADQLQSTLEVGTTFTLISNKAATPISGSFANLADGAILTVNGNKLQANYEGGDGNDLTLTVVP